MIIYPWHIKLRDQLLSGNSHLPHAVLFYAAPGTGLDQFVLTLSRDLLCQQRDEKGHACGKCASCHWFDIGNNPDFKLLCPASLGEEYGQQNVTESSDSQSTSNDKKKSLSQKILIEQVRSLASFVNITTHSGGWRIIMIYPAESMNVEAANALLKTLEEPPDHTLFFIVSMQYDLLLPTIRSRCMKVAVPMPTHEQALQWLVTQKIENAEVLLAQQGGAPLLAVDEKNNASRAELQNLISALAHPRENILLEAADKLQKLSRQTVIDWYERWLYDLQLAYFTQSVRYFVQYEKQALNLSQYLDVQKLQKIIDHTIERRRFAQHPLVMNVAIEDMLLEYRSIFTKRA